MFKNSLLLFLLVSVNTALADATPIDRNQAPTLLLHYQPEPLSVLNKNKIDGTEVYDLVVSMRTLLKPEFKLDRMTVPVFLILFTQKITSLLQRSNDNSFKMEVDHLNSVFKDPENINPAAVKVSELRFAFFKTFKYLSASIFTDLEIQKINEILITSADAIKMNLMTITSSCQTHLISSQHFLDGGNYLSFESLENVFSNLRSMRKRPQAKQPEDF